MLNSIVRSLELSFVFSFSDTILDRCSFICILGSFVIFYLILHLFDYNHSRFTGVDTDIDNRPSTSVAFLSGLRFAIQFFTVAYTKIDRQSY